MSGASAPALKPRTHALVYTFSAHRMLKGDAADTVTLRMHRAASMYARAPRFVEGQEVLLFLYPESDLRILARRSVSGRGCSWLQTLRGGEKTVANERGNSRLFKGMNMEKICPGATFPGIRQRSLDGAAAPCGIRSSWILSP